MLKVTVSGKDRLVVRMVGKINEASDLELVKLPKAPVVEVDMVDVTSINSMGIRQFRDWSHRLTHPEIYFSYLPRIIVDQFNLVVDLIPRQSKVISFYMPYFSEETGEEKKVLFIRGEHFESSNGEYTIKWPAVYDSANNEMEADVLVEKFLGFLKRY